MVGTSIFETAISGDVNGVRRLVEQEKVNPNSQYDRSLVGMTPLHVACERGHFPVIKYLIGDAHADVGIVDEDGWSALHMACANEVGVQIVSYLVEEGGMDIHAKNKVGNTPLHFASLRSCMDTIKYLVEQRQAKVNAKSRLGSTPLHLALNSREPNTTVVRYLLPKMRYVDRQILHRVWKGDFPCDIKEMVLEKYAAGQRLNSAFNKIPLHTILQRFPLPSKEAFRDCIENYPRSLLSVLDFQGRLPIHGALTSPNPAVKSPLIISTLARLEPRSLLTRDPTTGLYPHETITSFVSSTNDEEGWLNVMFEMLRCCPEDLLHARAGAGDRW